MSVLKRIGRHGELLWEHYFNETGIDIPASNMLGEVFVNTIDSLPGKRHKFSSNGTALWPDTLLGRIPDAVSYKSGAAFADDSGGAYGISRTIFETTYNLVTADGQLVFGDGIILPTTRPPMYVSSDANQGIFFQSGFANEDLKRIRKNGTLAWKDPFVLCLDSLCRGNFGNTVDFAGGLISLWAKTKQTPGFNFQMQRVDSSGQLLWEAEGITVYSSPFLIEVAANAVKPVVSDKRGGALFTWVLNAQGFRIFIKQVSANGILGEVTTGLEGTSTFSHESVLLQNYPNPFNSTTLIQYTLTQSTRVDLSVYNLLGQKVASLISQEQSAGEHRVEFDASLLSSGIYFYRLQIDKNTVTSKKMLIIN